MNEQPKVEPKYELKVFGLTQTEDLKILQDLFLAGWRPDPVLMPTGRPNAVDNGGLIYHLIKLPTNPDEARIALLNYSNSQPTDHWDYIMGVKAVINKQEMALKTAQIISDNPVPAPEEIAYIIEVANKEEDMKAAYEKGYRVLPDKIYQKTTVMRLLKKDIPPSGSPVSPPSP